MQLELFVISAYNSGFMLNNNRSSKICMQRGGESALTRPSIVEGKCPSGYQVCGTGSSAICFPSNVLCPYTRLIVAPSDTQFNAPDDDFTKTSATLSNGYVIFGRRSHPNERPLVKATAALTQYPAGSQLVKNGILANPPNTRGPCVLKSGTEVFVDNSLPKNQMVPSTAGLGGAISYSNPIFASQCPKSDIRWVNVDALDMESFLLDNFQSQVSDCLRANQTLYPVTSSRFNAANDPSIYYSGTPNKKYASVQTTLLPSKGLNCAIISLLHNNFFLA